MIALWVQKNEQKHDLAMRVQPKANIKNSAISTFSTLTCFRHILLEQMLYRLCIRGFFRKWETERVNLFAKIAC